jgi:hypothetical protein
MSAMVPRVIGWIGVVCLVPALLWLTLARVPQASRELQAERQHAEQERQRLESTLKDLNAQFKGEEDRYARILRRFPWLAEPSDGTAFLTRLGDVVTGLSLKVMGIGAVQREATAQLEKLGRQVRVAGRFSDTLRLVENVEQHKGFVEELRIQRPQARGDEEAAEEIEAQFRLSSVELTPDVRTRMRAFIGALPDGSKPGPMDFDGSPLLPVPEKADPAQVASLRDPFMNPGASRRKVVQVEAKAPLAEAKFPDLLLTGIIESPTVRAAIINHRAVREGERVEGILVEAIRTHEVMLRSPFGVKRLTLASSTKKAMQGEPEPHEPPLDAQVSRPTFPLHP